MSSRSNLNGGDNRWLNNPRKERDKAALWRARLDVVWRDVKEDIELSIVSGYYREGGKAPSKDDIVSAYGVSEVTALKVLKMLEDDGIVEKIKGSKGRIVKLGVREMLGKYHQALMIRRLGDIINVAIRCGISKDTLIAYLVSSYDKRKSGGR